MEEEEEVCRLAEAIVEAVEAKKSDEVRLAVEKLLGLGFHKTGGSPEVGAKVGRALLRAARFPEKEEALCEALCGCLNEVRLGAEGAAAEAAIAAECVVPRSEGLVLEYLVNRALESGKTADVKKAWAARQGLEKVRNAALVARAAAHPSFLKLAAGRAFLGSALERPETAPSFHEVVKAQLPLATTKLSTAYGECYFKAWDALAKPSRALAKSREAFERDYLQDLARAALVCSSEHLHEQLAVVLGSALHERKGSSPRIDAAIDNVYAPLLWRHLTAANAKCRERAVRLLADAFPVGDAIEPQLEALRAALSDDCASVRVAATAACGDVLPRFADARLPARRAAAIVRDLAANARDSASATARAAALRALGAIATEARAIFPTAAAADRHAKNALYAARRGARDATPRCRDAFWEAVGAYARHTSPKSQAKAVLDIVSESDLLARLREDAARCPAAADRLVALVSDVYFPSGRVSADHVERALALADADALAADAFYSRLPSIATPEACAKFVVMLVVAASASAEDDDERDDDDDDASTAAKNRKRRRRSRRRQDLPTTVAKLLDVAATTLRALALDDDKDLQAYVADGVDDALATLETAVGLRSDLSSENHKARLALARLRGTPVLGDDENVVHRLATVASPTALDDLVAVCSRCDDRDAKKLRAPLVAAIDSIASKRRPARRRKTLAVAPAVALFVVSNVLDGPDTPARACLADDAVLAAVGEARSRVLRDPESLVREGDYVDPAALVELEAALAVERDDQQLPKVLAAIATACREATSPDDDELQQPRRRRRGHDGKVHCRRRRRQENDDLSPQFVRTAMLRAAVGLRDALCPGATLGRPVDFFSESSCGDDEDI
ncbi:hypothetical protein CTAYLR_007023 [Chrysophaeum taylorii]|uniref:Sister chromatid cohesion protein n=1 Tax=Chrysophaeum taylorii TaxID=2483200 RepID=A0AAD7XHC1_9STRA|nr:hypothetical protein CTAYLR_007023 [Chrysophaeum taylorii]